MRTAPCGRPSLEEEAVSGSRGTQRARPRDLAAGRLDRARRRRRPATTSRNSSSPRPAGAASSASSSTATAGVTLDDIAEVSRAVSEVLDANDDGMGRTPYVLEVTSPGVDRPLTEPRHWRRNIGRLVTVAVGPAGRTDEVTGADHRRRRQPASTWPSRPGRSPARRSGRRPRGTSRGPSSAPGGSRSSSAGSGRRRADDLDGRRRPPTTSTDDDVSQLRGGGQ